MKLPDFNSDLSFNNLRAAMGAVLVRIFTNHSDFHADIDEIRRRLSCNGIDVDFSEIQINDGTFEYHGQKVLVYIRDQRIQFNNGYKYHISNCSTLQGYISRGSLDRYVVSTRTDNKFLINIIGELGKIIESQKTVKLNVCKNCLKQLEYKGYNGQRNQRNINIYNNFSLSEFFEMYQSSQHIHLPTYNDVTAPVQIYTDDFNKVSKELRERKNWTCEQCRNNFIDNKQYLHVHHINGIVTDNSESNLEVLCKSCHQTRHSHLLGA